MMKLRMIILSYTLCGAALVLSGCSNPNSTTEPVISDTAVVAVDKNDALDGLDTADTSKSKEGCGCPPKKSKDEE